MRLLDDGTIDSKDKVLVPITGSGMKDLSMLENEAKAVPAIEPLPGTLERLLG
jgi:threonine synthase